MGNVESGPPGAASDGGAGGLLGDQLFVTLRMTKPENQAFPMDLVPHAVGGPALTRSWENAKAVALEREATNVWELSLVVPADHGVLDFKFVFKGEGEGGVTIVEEGPSRVLQGGAMAGAAGPTARFKFPTKSGVQFLQFPVSLQAVPVSPFALAASWRSLRKNLQSHGSMVRTIPDVVVDATPHPPEAPAHSLELDLEHYEVPAPDAPASTAAKLPVLHLPAPFYGESRLYRIRGGDTSVSPPTDSVDTPKRPGRCVSIKDLVVLGTEAEVQRGANGAVNGVGVNGASSPPRLGSDVSVIDGDVHLDNVIETVPEAAGALAAAALADRLMGLKERRQLAIVLVGLPARGKTFTAAKLTRYLRWLGHDTKHFNVGKYWHLKLGRNQTADFFRGDNQEGLDARNEVAVLAMEDMLAWMDEGGQVGVFDATNSTKARRNLLMKLAEGRCKMIFLEILCNDRSVIEANIQLKTTRSPDYADMPDYETALEDFRTRLDHYEKMYEPVTEGSYIKLIDMVRGQGGHMQVNNISGYLPGRIVFFLANTHITSRPIFLTRHGESQDNVRGRIGGDPALSELGEKYALKLADFVHKRLKNEPAASVWTSTLQRTGITARHINEFPKVQWHALDEINAGVCDGMTYAEIKESMPKEYAARKADKLRYRYPRGESYLDVIQRVEPVIVELERQRSPVVVIAHQAILRSLYAYFMDKPLKELPHIQVPLHTVIEIQVGVGGMQEKRYKLMEPGV